MTRVALVADHFVTVPALTQALADRVDLDTLSLSSTVLPWPSTPYGPVAEVSEASGTEEQAIEALRDAEVCVTQMAPVTERVLAACPRLRLVCVARGGPVNVNLEAARRHDVVVRSTPGRNASATAEHTVALMLAAARQLPQRHLDLLAGEWRSDYYELERCGPELAASTVGVVGYGAVGRRVAAMLRALGARVLVHDPLAADVPDAERCSDLPDLLSRADVVTLHARSTPETHHLVGASQIAAMKPGAILVNSARGELLDYDAACDALDSGQLAAAAFDVFPDEPLVPGARLLTTPHVVMTPHLAGATRRTAEVAAGMCADIVAEYVASESSRAPA